MSFKQEIKNPFQHHQQFQKQFSFSIHPTSLNWPVAGTFNGLLPFSSPGTFLSLFCSAQRRFHYVRLIHFYDFQTFSALFFETVHAVAICLPHETTSFFVQKCQTELMGKYLGPLPLVICNSQITSISNPKNILTRPSFSAIYRNQIQIQRLLSIFPNTGGYHLPRLSFSSQCDSGFFDRFHIFRLDQSKDD